MNNVCTLARALGGQMQGAATQAMWVIVEKRQRRRCPPSAVPLRAAVRRHAGVVARSLHANQQQSVNVIH